MSSLILASQSPRRKELLTQAGYTFTSSPSLVEEKLAGHESPKAAVEKLALQKAEDVSLGFPEVVVLGADTVISLNGSILGKPASKEEAEQTLSALSGRTHHVYTGVALCQSGVKTVFHVKTEVTFLELASWQIEAYLSIAEPYDKAGAYGIQGQGCLFVESINGDYFNVMGLPISRVSRELQSFQLFPSFLPHLS